MQNSTLVNLIVICGILAFCVMTLIAVYASVAQPSEVLLFEENFNKLDESKWEGQIFDCGENGKQFHYANGVDQNGYIRGGILRVLPLHVPTDKNCRLCTEGKCTKSLYSVKLETKNSFDVKFGKIEMRVKLPTSRSVKASIGIIPTHKGFEEGQQFHVIETTGERNASSPSLLEVFMGRHGNASGLGRNITADEFHVYEIKWWIDGETTFKIDGEEVTFSEGKESANSTGVKPFNKPFFLYLSLNFGERDFFHSDDGRERSENDSTDFGNDSNSESDFQVDYIKLYQLSD